MSDPRKVTPSQRRNNHSPLMIELARKNSGDVEVVNFCPFGCEDAELDERGYCGHLYGFFNGGATFEPRGYAKDTKGKPTGPEVVMGEKRQPMKKGYKLVKITTSARVYGPDVILTLHAKKGAVNPALAEAMEQERRLVEFAEKIRNPVLQGDWDGGAYDPIEYQTEKPPA